MAETARAVEIIAAYANDEKTGNLVLVLESGHTASVYLKDGKLYSTLINNEFPSVGSRIFSFGDIDPDAFAEALRESQDDANSPRFLELLVRKKLISRNMLLSYIKDVFLSDVRSILSWDVVDYAWRSNETTDAFVVPPIPLDVAYDKVMDNLQVVAGIMDEVYAHTYDSVTPEEEAELDPEVDAERLVPAQANEPSRDEISPEQYRVWEHIDGRSTLDQIMNEYGQVIIPLLRAVYVLWAKGFISLRLYGENVSAYDKARAEAWRNRELGREEEPEQHYEKGIDIDNIVGHETPAQDENDVNEYEDDVNEYEDDIAPESENDVEPVDGDTFEAEEAEIADIAHSHDSVVEDEDFAVEDDEDFAVEDEQEPEDAQDEDAQDEFTEEDVQNAMDESDDFMDEFTVEDDEDEPQTGAQAEADGEFIVDEDFSVDENVEDDESVDSVTEDDSDSDESFTAEDAFTVEDDDTLVEVEDSEAIELGPAAADVSPGDEPVSEESEDDSAEASDVDELDLIIDDIEIPEEQEDSDEQSEDSVKTDENVDTDSQESDESDARTDSDSDESVELDSDEDSGEKETEDEKVNAESKEAVEVDTNTTVEELDLMSVSLNEIPQKMDEYRTHLDRVSDEIDTVELDFQDVQKQMDEAEQQFKSLMSALSDRQEQYAVLLENKKKQHEAMQKSWDKASRIYAAIQDNLAD